MTLLSPSAFRWPTLPCVSLFWWPFICTSFPNRFYLLLTCIMSISLWLTTLLFLYGMISLDFLTTFESSFLTATMSRSIFSPYALFYVFDFFNDYLAWPRWINYLSWGGFVPGHHLHVCPYWVIISMPFITYSFPLLSICGFAPGHFYTSPFVLNN